MSALEQVPQPSTIDAGQANGIQSPNTLPFNNLPLWGIVGLLALWLVPRGR